MKSKNSLTISGRFLGCPGRADLRTGLWRSSVPYYRLYFLDRRGRFGGVEGFAAENDDFAIRQAEKHGEAVKELWCGGRRVKQWREGKAA